MKFLLIAVMLMVSTSCGLFEKAKKPVVKKASEIAKELSVKHLKCSTGDAVFSDVEKQLKKMLKVKDDGQMKSIAGTVCTLAVEPVVSGIFDGANKKLPDSWIEDGCSLDGFQGDAKELASKLCSKI